ncbi:MAG: tRNA uridine-5-carboxymethylaminomethyl(34) synthesis GTPase MnmE [Gemmatimonadaceae bacterium]|nr:tRNA uridine-5-carboxymethylaminomethyl(34) synthesis GTPase MnmE [Gemmatimonadaceae bacterium]
MRGDTIVAQATAAGRAAVALIRLSGPDARGIAARIGVSGDLVPRRATRVRLHDCDDASTALDDALVTLFVAPHSFTGENLIEFGVHGGSYVAQALLGALMAAGARPALAGEFTERAVRHGKLDLLQAEAVADLIDARSRATHRAALRQLSGALSRRLLALREALIAVEALIAYDLDFPEEDDGPQPRARAVSAAAEVLAALDALGATLPASELGRDGVAVVLAGAPNAGKSSLLNVLVGDARAIVSEVPGTTRDAIEVLVDAHPYPWRLVDTAGLRSSDDAVERLGLEVSARWLARAQIVLVCGEDATALAVAERAVAQQLSAGANNSAAGAEHSPQLVVVRTKADLASDATPTPPHAVEVSALTGEGLDALRAAITAAVQQAYPEPPEDQPMVTRARHAAAIAAAREEVAAFRDAWAADVLPAPVAATHLRAAIHALDELTGAIDVDEVLERVFRAFCVGK